MHDKENKSHVTLLHGFWINEKTFNIRVVAVLIAAEVLLAFSPFGFIVLPGISITTMFIGVLVAALWSGPISGAAVGLVFGLTGMWKASITAVNPNDMIFSPIRSGNPAGSILLALGPRLLFGIAAGLVYYVILRLIPPKNKARLPVVMLASAVLERVHSMLTYLFMDKVFHVEGVYMGKAWKNLFTVNHLQTFTVTMVIIALAYWVFDRFISRNYYEQYAKMAGFKSKFGMKYKLLEFAAVVVIGLTASHLWERILIVLFDIDKFNPEVTHINLIAQVIFQFVVAALSSLYIVVMFFKHDRNMEEMLHLAEEKAQTQKMEMLSLKDSMTNVFNRKGLERVIAEEKLDSCPVGYFLIDVDHFKEINDSYGHGTGDLILTETAKCLMEIFGERRVFRLGGDEFSALTKDGLLCDKDHLMKDWETVTRDFEEIHTHLSNLPGMKVSVTLSVGACYSEKGYHEKLYPLTDSALYETKSHGRAGCTLVAPNGLVLSRWKDPRMKTQDSLAELGHIGICRIVYAADESAKPRMFCNESTRNLMCVPLEATPEECYEIWKDGIDASDLPKLPQAKQMLLKNGAVAYNYVWNHPLKGKIRVESGGTGKRENGLLLVVVHHQLYLEEKAAAC